MFVSRECTRKIEDQALGSGRDSPALFFTYGMLNA